MLGEILGRSAGLTSAEPVLLRLLLVRLGLPPEDPGDRRALARGLGLVEAPAVAAVGVPIRICVEVGVSLADTRGVA